MAGTKMIVKFPAAASEKTSRMKMHFLVMSKFKAPGNATGQNKSIEKKYWELHSMATDASSLNNDQIIRILVESIEGNLEEVSLMQSNYDIFRVPKRSLKLNPEAYTPLLVSVGPLHYNREQLRTMETHKLYYLQRFLNRSNRNTLHGYVRAMSNLEEAARKCYSETAGLGKEEFVRVMVIDACFILEFIIAISLDEDDHFLSNLQWRYDIMADLLKLENQLPFFVLEHIYGVFQPYGTDPLSNNIYWVFLAEYGAGLHGPSSYEEIRLLTLSQAKHLLDLLRHVLVPPSQRSYGGAFVPLTCCASKLRSAGVKFQKKERSISPKTYLFDITFDKEKGILTIPTITVLNDTEVLLRNLIACEKSQRYTPYFAAYACFMEYLITTPSDAELLMEKGIINNYFGSSKDVATLFSNLGKNSAVYRSYLSVVTKDLEHYHGQAWNKSKATLLQNYFNTPWRSISVGAAALLLILTIIQTVCSVLQVK